MKKSVYKIIQLIEIDFQKTMAIYVNNGGQPTKNQPTNLPIMMISIPQQQSTVLAR